MRNDNKFHSTLTTYKRDGCCRSNVSVRKDPVQMEESLQLTGKHILTLANTVNAIIY